MIRYTGHPFVDVGVAIVEHILKRNCESLEEDDLLTAGNRLQEIYSRKDIKGYLTVHFPNSGWCNATISKENKDKYIKKVLESYKQPSLNPHRSCSFCENHAQFLADRQHIPMLTGMTLIVTAPYGVTGLPVCGYCLFAIQFYPLATLKVQGKPLFWWSPSSELTWELASLGFEEFMEYYGAMEDKFPNRSWPRTRLLENVREVTDKAREQNLSPEDCYGYHVTNYGSGPDYRRYRVPKSLLDFWKDLRMEGGRVQEVHSWIESAQWERPKQKRQNGDISVDSDNKNKQNYYYEALSVAFDEMEWQSEARRIVSRFFLILNKNNLDKNCFDLAELFLRKVGGMDKQRLEIIRKTADLIADVLVLGNNEKYFVTYLYQRERKSQELMRYLIKTQKRLSELGKPIDFDEILTMLDMISKDDTGPKDIWLVRDLLLLRMLETLGRHNHSILQEFEENDDREERS